MATPPPQQVTHSQVVDVNFYLLFFTVSFSCFQMFLGGNSLFIHTRITNVSTLLHLQSIIFIDNLVLMRPFISGCFCIALRSITGKHTRTHTHSSGAPTIHVTLMSGQIRLAESAF